MHRTRLFGFRFVLVALFAAAAVAALPGTARAEADQLRLARQFGIAYLPFLMMEKHRLVEKHAAAQGLGTIKVTWAEFGGGSTMNDALLSGSLDFGAAGIPPFLTLWDKTKDSQKTLVAAGFNNIPVFLNTTNPAVKSIEDFGPKDKIAVPAVKVSLQALVLQMAAAKKWGMQNYDKLDSLTVSMKHPDAMATLLSPSSEVTAHFAAPPYMFQELEDKRVRIILDSQEVLGPANFNVVFTTRQFRDSNPKLYGAFLAALDESMAMINADKRAATQLYIDMTKAKTETFDAMYKIVTDPRVEFTTVPNGLMKFAAFLHQAGRLKTPAQSWKDFCFPEAQAKAGS